MNNTRAHITTLAAAMLIAILLAGCTATPKVVTVTEYKERVVHDTTYQTRYDTRIDSVYVHDTTFVDTAGVVHANRTKNHFREVARIDTIYKTIEVHHTDSIPYPVEVVKEVPRQLNGWQRFILGSGYGLWAVLILGLISFILAKVMQRHIWPISAASPLRNKKSKIHSHH